MEVTGRFEISGDTDWHRVELEPARTYVFTLENSGGSGSFFLADSLEVLTNADDDGFRQVRLDDARSLDAGPRRETGVSTDDGEQVVLSTNAGGAYFVAVDQDSVPVGPYTVTYAVVPDDFLDTVATDGMLDPGATISGRLERPGDADWIRATLTPGTTYKATLEADFANAIVSLASVADSPGAGISTGRVARSPFEADSTVITPYESGEYVIQVSTDSRETGAYTVSLEAISDDYPDNAASAGRLDLDTPLQATHEAAGDVDWFSFEAAPGTAYHIQAFGAGSVSLGVFSASDSDGLFEEAPRFGNIGGLSSAAFTAKEGGTYIVQARSVFADGVGDYTLSATRFDDDYPDTTQTGATLIPGGSVAGALEVSGDQDYVRMDLDANQTYRLTVEAAAGGHPGLRAITDQETDGFVADDQIGFVPIGASGRVETAGFRFNTAETSAVFTPATASTWYAVVDSTVVGSGQYTLRLEPIADDLPDHAGTPGLLAPSGTFSGRFDARGDADWVRMDLPAGRSYSLDMQGPDQFGAEVRVVSADDGDGLVGVHGDLRYETGGRSGLTFTTREGGTYYAVADGFSIDPTDYVLSLTEYTDDFPDHAASTNDPTAPGSGDFSIATAGASAQVAAIYIGYYGRAPEPAGFGFWLGEHANLRDAGKDGAAIVASIADRFADVQESIDNYPFLTQPEPEGAGGFVDSVFTQLFNRSAEPAGQAFYADRVLSQLADNDPIGNIVLDIMNGARDEDAATLENKTDIAVAFAESLDQPGFEALDNGVVFAREIVAGVTDSPASVEEALAAISLVGAPDVGGTDTAILG